MYRLAADHIGFSTNGTIAAAITPGGNLCLYNTEGTFYTTIVNQPTSNNALILPNSGNATLQAGMMAVTGSGLNQFASTTSAQLAGIISDKTGSGSLVFDTAPAITSPTVTGGSINNTPIGSTTPNTGNFTSLSINGAAITANVTEINKLDGLKASTAELNKLDGLKASTAELNTLTGVTVSNTNINTLSGVTVNVGTQLAGKENTITGAATTITSSNLTASRVLVSNASGKVAVSAITSTNLDALSGISSAGTIESRLGTLETGKAPISNPIFTGEIEAPRIHLTSTSDANTTNSVSAIQVGPSTGINLVIDNDEVMVRNNNAPGQLALNGDGGNVIIGGNTSTTSLISLRAATVSASGDIVADGNVTAYSDARLKENVRTIDGALDKVSQMRGVYFDKDGKAGTGVIAQEIEKVLPEVVLDGEYKSVAYGNLVGVLIEAIKELKKEIDELKSYK
jgi:hypothetical protein